MIPITSNNNINIPTKKVKIFLFCLIFFSQKLIIQNTKQ